MGAETPLSLTNIAKHFAPVFVVDRFKVNTGTSEEACKYNIPTLINFDGNWISRDNETNYEKFLEQNLDALAHPDKYRREGMSQIYFEAIASKTHVFLTYYLFYPHDANDNCAFASPKDGGGHLNDASSLMMIVRKDKKSGRLEWVIMQDSGDMQFHRSKELKLAGEKPIINVSSGNHTMKAIDKNKTLPERKTHYFFGANDRYDLVPINKQLWTQRGNKDTFCNFDDPVGIQFCDEINKHEGRGTPPWAPWAREFDKIKLDAQRKPGAKRGVADSFTDPIRAFESLYEANKAGYSKEYISNPYK